MEEAILKHCNKCGVDKPATEEFFYRGGQRKCLSSPCITCVRAKAKIYWKERYNQPEYKELRRKWSLSCRYGITLEEYDHLAKEQAFKCAICLKDRPLFVDHAHETGKVRQLLCRDCNSAIGLLCEDKEILARAIAYLGKFEN